LSGRLRIGIDTGGTFTDLVVVNQDTGDRRTVKVPSTPKQPSAAVFEAVRRAAVLADDVEFTVLGTTIGTNCLIERKGTRTLYVTTEGFEDVPFIQRIDRRSLYDLQWLKPTPLVERRDCIGVRERIAHDGSVRTPLEEVEIDRTLERIAAVDEEVAVAINLLFSYVDPSHERRLAEAIRREFPDHPVSVSHEVAPIWREYERASTVIADAYLRRLTGAFARELDAGLDDCGVSKARALLKSNGGQVAIGRAARRPVDFILSGLAGGLIGARHFATAVGRTDVLTLDMGGTSADVGVIVGGTIQSRNSYEFEWGIPIATPVIDLSTIGAGGSSIADLDQGGLLKVGPESAGADPGPACYARGSTNATVTDANVVLGRLNPAYFLGGELPLDVGLAQEAVGRIADQLKVDLEAAAHSIIEIACVNMANAIRLLCADRGLDYRHFEIMAFGGAGPLHAGLLARRIGLPGVIVPPNPGLTSAFGAQAADLRVDRRITRLLRSDLSRDVEVASLIHRVASEASTELAEDGALEPVLLLTVSCRYRGQNFEQDVAVPAGLQEGATAALVQRFHEAHDAAYGYRLENAVVEFVHFNATAIETRSELRTPELAAGRRAEPTSIRDVYFAASGWRPTPIYLRAELRRGNFIAGPAVIEELDSTTLVLDGQAVTVDRSGTLLLTEHRAGNTTGVRSEELIGV
jgi:N-methylhydantoinase A